MNDQSAVTPIRPLDAQEDTLSADFTLTTAFLSRGTIQIEPTSRNMSQAEPPLVRELRQVVADLRGNNATQERQIKELRGAVVALMEPDMPRILRTHGGMNQIKNRSCRNFLHILFHRLRYYGPAPKGGAFHARRIKTEMKRLLSTTTIAAIALSAGLAASPAMASVIYTLNTPNAGIPGPAPYGWVNVDLFASNEALITFTSNTAGGYYFLDGGSAGVNSNGAATISNITGNAGAGASCPSGGSACYSNGGSGNEDGFGSFSNTINTTDGFTNKSSTISFDLTLTSGTWANETGVLQRNGGGSGFLAAAHVGQCDSATNCTSFSSTGFAADGPGDPVPEPTSLALLGVGLLGLGFVTAKRRN